MHNITEKAKKIKLLLLDIDGVMSDGQLYFTNSHDEFKSFDVQDGLGLVFLQKSGINVGIITGKTSNIVAKRAEKLKIKHLYQGYFDKGPALADIIKKLDIDPEHIAYMGDDILDLPVLTRVGLPIAPANAHDIVKQHVDYITQKSGGHGAVREVCDLIMTAQGTLDSIIDKLKA